MDLLNAAGWTDLIFGQLEKKTQSRATHLLAQRITLRQLAPCVICCKNEKDVTTHNLEKKTEKDNKSSVQKGEKEERKKNWAVA